MLLILYPEQETPCIVTHLFLQFWFHMHILSKRISSLPLSMGDTSQDPQRVSDCGWYGTLYVLCLVFFFPIHIYL